MHYYKRNIGDYHRKAGRLSILQHGVYTLLIDGCYDRECFPTKEDAVDWCWASTTEEIEAVEFVLVFCNTLVCHIHLLCDLQLVLVNCGKTKIENRIVSHG